MKALALAYLVAYAATLSTVLGALAFVMIAHLTGATWFVVLRRQAEQIAAVLPWLAALFLPILALAPELYPWAAPERLGAESRAFVEARRIVLNLPAFALRSALYLGVWCLFGTLLRRASLRQDADGDPAHGPRQVRLSAAGLPLLVLTMSFAAFDWLMTLSLPWHSTIYGLYYFIGGLAGAFALLALLAALARRSPDGLGGLVRPDHLQALGKLLLVALLLWAYVGYAQFLIIWIADLPRESSWYLSRLRGGWAGLGLALVLGHFALPVALLLSRRLKRDWRALLALGLGLLLLHYLDTLWLLWPGYGPEAGWVPWLAAPAGLAAVLGSSLVVARRQRRREAPFPSGDPLLARSAEYRSP